MKAILCKKYGPPEVLQLAEVEKPVPQHNEVLIKVHATTVTVADFRIRSFTVPPSFWIPARLALGLTKPKRPILGVELAGEVEAIGKNVTRFKEGDQVMAATLKTFGAYAQYKCLPENDPIAPKPANLSYHEAAAIPIGARTALHYLRLARIKSQQKVLIYGASGSVGTYAVQIAKYFGAIVTGVCSSANLALVKSLGADKVLDYTSKDFTGNLEQYDIIFMAVDKFPFSVCNKFLEKTGTYVNVTAPFKSLGMLLSRKKTIVGPPPPETADDLVFLSKLAADGVVKPVIDRTYSFDQVVEAHRYVDKGHKKGNVVITV
jgi:NADPH:quinone reductase-like Zn-dependent oxidoreductase